MWHKAVDFAAILCGSLRCNVCLLLLSFVIFSLCALLLCCACVLFGYWLLMNYRL